MAENEGVALRAIRWSEIFPWLSIAKSAGLAMTLRLMTFGAVAVLLTLLGWIAVARIFSYEGEPNRSWSGAFTEQTAWQVIDHTVPSRPFARSFPGSRSPAMLNTTDESGLNIDAGGPMIRTWAVLSQPVWQILSIQAPISGKSLTVRDFLSLVISAFWGLAVWAYFGAAISRVAAVQLATGEQVGWGASLRWAGNKWLAYFSAPLLPILGVALAVVPILLLGLLMRSSFLAVLIALAWPLLLAAGFVMAILLVGVLLGWPLMWATVSVEGTDSFDALNRTYSYIFQRPFRSLFYTIVATLIGWLGWFVVENFAASVIWLASWAAGIQRIQELTVRSSESSLAFTATSLIAFWAGWVKLLAIGYSFSYFGVASTSIYYLLRRDVDARETDEVYLDADTSEQKFGLPTLQKDTVGAPEIADKAAAVAGQSDGQSTNE